jgi:arylsulfatase A-like enzyme
MNADIEPVPPDSVPLTEQAKGAFKIVFDYLDELRRLGRYEDASIVITADHGHWINADADPLPGPRLTALFVKPAGSADAPLAHSEAPTEMANVRATLLADAGVADPDGRMTVFEVPMTSTTPRDFFYRRGQNVDEGLIDHWQVRGDARDFANWHFIGETRTYYWK